MPVGLGYGGGCGAPRAGSRSSAGGFGVLGGGDAGPAADASAPRGGTARPRFPGSPAIPARPVPAHLGQHLRLPRAQVPDAAAHGALLAALPGPGRRESSERLPGTAPAPPGPAPTPPPRPWTLPDPCPPGQRSGGDGGAGGVGTLRGSGDTGECGGYK